MAEAQDPEKKNAFSFGVHSGAASSWDDQACAKLCDMVLLANNGLAQQVALNDTTLMDVLPTSELEGPIDDLGLTLVFLAVYHDQPEMLEYLRKRGVDLKATCDPMEYCGYGVLQQCTNHLLYP